MWRVILVTINGHGHTFSDYEWAWLYMATLSFKIALLSAKG